MTASILAVFLYTLIKALESWAAQDGDEYEPFLYQLQEPIRIAHPYWDLQPPTSAPKRRPLKMLTKFGAKLPQGIFRNGKGN
jgi:hypothetical protein